MKIITLYYDRYKTATTSQALHDINKEHTILCHNNKEKFENIYGELIQTNQPKGIQNNFNYGLSLLEKNEWALFMSDDYKQSYRLNSKSNKFEECGLDYIINQVIETTKIADKINVKLIGLNATGNPFYSKKKYGKYGLVDGRMLAIKKTDFTFHDNINTIPDYYCTLYHLKKYGGNLIIQKCYSDFERYGDGGIGNVDERLKDKYKDITILKNLFPNNVVVKNKIGQPKNSHIIIKR